jgi:hypothetical protein
MNSFDALHDRLAALSPLVPDAQRSARTTQRCRMALQRRAPTVSHEVSATIDGAQTDRGGPPAFVPRTQPAPGLAFRTAAAGAVGLLCVVYVLSLIVTTFSLGMLLR